MQWFRNSKKSNPASDEALVVRYRESADLAVLGELFQRHAEMVYYVCLRYLEDSERSKDAVMQIFEELIVKINKQEIKQFVTWLYVLSKNHCLMQLRTAGKLRLEELKESLLDIGADNDLERVHSKELLLSKMETALDSLNLEQKTCISLYYLENHSYQEIVDKTGYNGDQVKSYIQNGKRNLKNMMLKNTPPHG